MTVETSTRKATFAGGQSVLTFNFRTLVSNPEYIQVALVNLSTSIQTNLTYNVDYTVTINSNGVGGIVTIIPTYSTGYNYVVYRQTTPVQDSAYSDYNQFPAATLENNLDQLTMVAQEQEEDNQRTLTYPISASSASTILPVPLADAFLQWNSDASALINATIPDPSTLVKATNSDATGGTEDPHYMTAAKVLTEITTFAVRNVSSSTTDVTIVSGSTTVISSINAALSGANKILRLTSSGTLPALDGSLLTSIGNLAVSGILGTPIVQNFNQAYQATTDGLVVAWANYIMGSVTPIGYANAINPPTSGQYIAIQNNQASNSYACISFFVLKGQYYEVTIGSYDNRVMTFTPIGS